MLTIDLNVQNLCFKEELLLNGSPIKAKLSLDSHTSWDNKMHVEAFVSVEWSPPSPSSTYLLAEFEYKPEDHCFIATREPRNVGKKPTISKGQTIESGIHDLLHVCVPDAGQLVRHYLAKRQGSALRKLGRAYDLMCALYKGSGDLHTVPSAYYEDTGTSTALSDFDRKLRELRLIDVD